ncbi:MAG: LacI family DNA-binding transcriptional regulator [Firmicutes bacterium]|nr:LacI family DNA-binding transcriptional regulator [Bacillota bacterium]
MATIREVAAVAGVSRSTVSLVLNDSPLVKAETREHVLSVIREMKYVPNNNARSLSNKIMNSLGVIILLEYKGIASYDFDSNTGLFAEGVLRGIATELADTDYSVDIEYFKWNEDTEELPRLIKNKRVDGACIIGNAYSQTMVDKIKELGIPIVTIEVGCSQMDIDCVFSDPQKGVLISLEHLMEKGHEKICYLNGKPKAISSKIRENAIRLAEQQYGLSFNWDWMVYCERNDGLGGYSAMKEAWESGIRPEVVLTANAEIALGAERYLHEQGQRVPDDISVMGYDDNAISGYAIPALSTINIRKDVMGQKAAELLLKRLDDPDRACEKIEVHPYLVERDSVRTIVR